ncbi:hypothetical protein HQ865_06935 [Mucilaginibacter mali]|uniref:Outer membrane protein beta-barrel domain-containing protein n=1 Tax=Mucilaginibacter mali TaxID=2740462 RepID=A0A7D4UCM5_9SPHI|nr:hypothetical protein [Mucilaginibacter mali]QKJ29499.1 hypothetical protein HQ865_06935 [Mucilaginibacter mali]
MKNIILTLLICVLSVAAKAQFGYNYSQYEFGLSAGINKAKTDFRIPKTGYAAMASFTYNYTPFINYIAELQVGGVKADSLSVIPGSALTFTNDYTTVSFRAQLQMGEIMDYSQSQFANFLKNIYVSGGVGVIYTDLKIYDSGFLSGESKGSNVFIPVKLGYEFKFFNSFNEPRMKLDFGYQRNLIMSDAFDGISYGSNKDSFSQFVIGLKFALGGETSYRKSITY